MTNLEIANLDKFNLNHNFLIFSGIGSPINFKNLLKNNKFKIIKEIIFSDHYTYKKIEVEKIIRHAKDIGAKILTTEKDFVKIKKFDLGNIDYVDLRLTIKEKEKFKELLKKKLYE